MKMRIRRGARKFKRRGPAVTLYPGRRIIGGVVSALFVCLLNRCSRVAPYTDIFGVG